MSHDYRMEVQDDDGTWAHAGECTNIPSGMSFMNRVFPGRQNRTLEFDQDNNVWRVVSTSHPDSNGVIYPVHFWDYLREQPQTVSWDKEGF